MKARKFITLRQLGLTAVGVLAIPAIVPAQPPGMQNRVPDKDAAFIMVTAFKSPSAEVALRERGIGAQAAEALRSKISSDFPFKQLYVLPKERIEPNLVASGFSTTEGLALHDMKALAGMLRADYYISGTANRTPGNVKLTGDVVLTRGVTFRQPLGTFEGPKLDVAVGLLSKELREALKQMDGEKKCTNAAREKKYPEAIAFAQAGITAYPKATLARTCLATVLDVSGAPVADVLKVTQEIIALDPKSNEALKIQASAYRRMKNTDSLVATLVRLLQTDMTNAKLQTDVITEIASSGSAKIARPIVDTAVTLNPGDPDLLKLRWLILNATSDYKEMYKQGEELVRLDTSFADSSYFIRTANAYASDSQPQKAAEAAARGVAKFPTNKYLVGYEIQMLQAAGQQQQALEKLDKAMAAKIPIENGGARRLALLRDLKRTNEILPAIKALIAAGDTTTALRANLFAQLGTDSKALVVAATTMADTITAYRKGLEMMFFADSVIKSGPQVAETQFRLGGAQLQLGSALYTQAGRMQAQKQLACPVAKEARDHLTDAQILLPKGGSFNGALTSQFMGILMQLNPNVDTLVGAVCGK